MKLFAHTIITTVLFISCLTIWASHQPTFNIHVRSLRKQQPETDALKGTPKYMTYLPHSGLHNQRISLINALIIAHALNRTLLMPELNIGEANFWSDSSVLAKQLELCPLYIKQRKKEYIRRLGCQAYRKYRPLSVESIFDLSSAHALDIYTEQRSDMSRDYIFRHASANQLDNSVYTLQDPFRYTYQIHDHDPSLDELQGKKSNDKYLEHIELDELRSRSESYLEFGSLFGTSRLELHKSELVWLREHLHRTTGINHPEVNLPSQTIVQALGDKYTSVHLRQGDGVFQKMAPETIAQVELALLDTLSSSDNNTYWKDRLRRITSVQERLKECRSAQDLVLKMIYLATDASNPQQGFPQIFDRYPCIFTLGDFYNAKVNGGSLLPMIDAEIASHAKLFIGTPKSTYSAYVRYRNQHYRNLDFFSH